MRRVFVRWTNTLSKTWSKYSSHARIPSPKYGASIRPLDEYPLHNKRHVFVRGRIPSPNHEVSICPLDDTLPKTWGKYSSHARIPSPKHGTRICPMDEYPLQHTGQVFVLWTNTLTGNLGQVLARGRIVPIRQMGLSGIRQIYSYSCGVCNIEY